MESTAEPLKKEYSTRILVLLHTQSGAEQAIVRRERENCARRENGG